MKETISKKSVLLAFGDGALNQAVLKNLQDKGFQVTTIEWEQKVNLPKKEYDYLVQLGTAPLALTKGTEQLLEKAKEDKGEFLLISSLKVGGKVVMTKRTTHHESLRLAEALTIEFHKRYGVRAVILRLPTIFGPEIPPKDSGTLGHLVEEFITDQPTLTVYGEGKDNHYFLHLTDAAEAVEKALTFKNKGGDILFATPSNPISSANIAQLLVNIGRGKQKIRYHKGLTAVGEEIKLEGKLLPDFKPAIPLEEGIKRMLETSPEDTKQKKPPLKIPPLKRPWRSRIRGWFLSKRRMTQLAILLLLFSPLIYTGGRLSLVAFHLTRLYQQARLFNFQGAAHSAKMAKANLTALDHLFGMVPILSRKTPLYDLKLLSQGAAEASAAAIVFLGEGETVLTTAENLFKGYQGEPIKEQSKEDFYRLATSFKEAQDKLLTAWGCFTQTHPTIRHLIAPFTGLSQQGAAIADLGSAFASSASDVLGYQGERNYLILFQNSAELRAGGGFLGSLAQLTLKNGGIKSLDFFDSYQFDHINTTPTTPVPAIKKFTNSKELPLRESNFYASFPESARRISQIFELSHDIEVDGVIGIDLLLAEELVGATGPLDLTDFDRTISSENLFVVTTEEVEKGFFPGSSKKRRFLQALGEGLLTKLLTLQRDDYARISKVIWEGLKRRDLLLSFEEGSLAQTLIETGFDGRVKTSGGDFLMVLDSSYGKKANIWIERKIDYKVFNVGRNDQLQGELTVTWTHRGTKAWPSGVYTNIFRVLVPKKSRLKKALLNEGAITSKTLTTEEAGKTEFALRFSVKPQMTAVLKLAYRLPSPLNLKEINQYSLYVQKQPGTRGDIFTFAFEEPFGKLISGEGLQRIDSNLRFSGSLREDTEIKINISEKVR